jgi:pyruvate/2-oxoglutarate dehydrogenase complex dihydrolipoamide acyltransferase (E2) component
MGLSMDSGLIVRWLKNSGDIIRPGELLLEVESDKSIVEVEAVEAGTLHILLGPDDGQIPVGAVIAYLLTEGEQAPATAGSQPAAEAEIAAPAAVEIASETFPIQTSTRLHGKRPPSSPAARRLAGELSLDWTTAAPSGLRGQIKTRDILMLQSRIAEAAVVQPSASPEGKAIQITPVARRMAEATGVDLDGLASKHPGKRLERADVEQELKKAVEVAGQPAVQRAVESPGKDGGVETVEAGKRFTGVFRRGR